MAGRCPELPCATLASGILRAVRARNLSSGKAMYECFLTAIETEAARAALSQEATCEESETAASDAAAIAAVLAHYQMVSAATDAVERAAAAKRALTALRARANGTSAHAAKRARTTGNSSDDHPAAEPSGTNRPTAVTLPSQPLQPSMVAGRSVLKPLPPPAAAVYPFEAAHCADVGRLPIPLTPLPPLASSPPIRARLPKSVILVRQKDVGAASLTVRDCFAPSNTLPEAVYAEADCMCEEAKEGGWEIQEALRSVGGWALCHWASLREAAPTAARLARCLHTASMPTLTASRGSRPVVVELAGDGTLLVRSGTVAEMATVHGIPPGHVLNRGCAAVTPVQACSILGQGVDVASAEAVLRALLPDLMVRRAASTTHGPFRCADGHSGGLTFMAAADLVLRSWEYVCACEAAVTCLTFHQAAWGHCVRAVFADTCSAEAQQHLSSQPRLDVYYQGFRCNPFSQACGGMEPQLRRTRAVQSLEELQASLRFAAQTPPRALIIENVATLLTSEFQWAWRLLCALLSRVGPYTWRYQVISPVQDLHADTDRCRLWIVGLSDLAQ
jgi:hypothetical protein